MIAAVGGADAIDVVGRQRRVQWQRHGLPRDALRHREIAFAVAEAAAERGEVQRFVRYAAADAARFERVAERLARQRQAVERQQHAPHVPRLAVVAVRPRRQHACGIGGEAVEVAVDEGAAAGEELGQPRELRDADPGIDVRQIELAAGKGDVARAIGQIRDAVKAQRVDAPRLVVVVDDQRAALDRRDVLVRMEAERDEVADRADVASLPLRPLHERGVLDHAQPVPPRERVQGIHVDQRAGPVRRDDRARARADRRLDRGEVDIAGDEIAIDEHGLGADLDDHVEDGEKALRRRDHLVAGTDAAKLQRDLDRGGGGRQHAGRAAAAKGGQRGLELPDPRAARELPRAQHVADAGDGGLVEDRAGELEVMGRFHRVSENVRSG